jgi:uncharacterized protein YheU (UPF0270 family)
MIVPHLELSDETLAGLLEEYVTRDGTELGEAAAKIEQVRSSLDRGELVLVYDPDSESCNILPARDVPSGKTR